ncbi:MAG: DEAD/DEAH box helicase family protein [Thermoguttaceae bacterium]|nr:DEAD/DEAH box helicase family protein [Thermoguttaceae bacterium]
MKLQFKRQQFQHDAADAVCEVFAGQPFSESRYMVDPGDARGQFAQMSAVEGWNNLPVKLSDEAVLANLQKVQRRFNLPPSMTLEGRYNLTIEMETGVGKTYTYIKTMYELNKRYGWRKFIVVVPSIAVREGVKKSFEILEEHFAEEYNKKIRYFVYNSSRLNEIDRFASDSSINVMIVNAQAFNATGKDARRIDMELDEFRSRKPIDVLAATNPILIIDEPQSVEGPKTKEGLKKFKPLMTLRYSATHRKESIYNMVYRLDAIDAYNQRLVKKIAVKGIVEKYGSDSDGYVYFEGVNVSKNNPTATIWHNKKFSGGVKQVRAVVEEKYNIYDHSGGLSEYRDTKRGKYVVKSIDGRDNSIELLNGLKLYAGDVVGKTNEEELRRVQIRETILTHIEQERRLFPKGIKVLSLFFIDEVAKYRQYDGGVQKNGTYANIFEEEYQSVVGNLQREFEDDAYLKYLRSITADKTHAGYFSVDKKGKMIDGKTNREGVSDDVDAYDLIMKNKELLLDLDPIKSPVRFIFSHSALREGWDNPNVFQICTLKQSSSSIRKRQEVGRGLRLCVDMHGDRQDVNALGNDVHNVNVLTVVASESYDSFAKGLQTEIAEAVAFRPKKVTPELFIGRELDDGGGKKFVIDEDTASEIVFQMRFNGYIDEKRLLTDQYHEDRKNGNVKVAEDVKDFAPQVIKIIDSVYDERAYQIDNQRKLNVEPTVDPDKLGSAAFKELWNRINAKSYYTVKFESNDLIKKVKGRLDLELHIAKPSYRVESGSMDKIESKETLEAGEAFGNKRTKEVARTIGKSNTSVKYDLVGRIVEETGLTRKTIVKILTGMQKTTFDQFAYNPEEFIAKASRIINEEKGSVIVQSITYKPLDQTYDTSIFTEPGLRGAFEVNAKKTPRKHLYDALIYDSKTEAKFCDELEGSEEVVVYVKLPNKFYISTPVGKYNPDWAIAFKEGSVNHVYFVAETKGSNSSLELRGIEKSKVDCAQKHFEALNEELKKKSKKGVLYRVVDSYDRLMAVVNGETTQSDTLIS